MSSNTSMNDRTDNRLTDLEIKASFLDDMLEELNKVIVRQQESIDLLRREVAELKGRVGEAGSPAAGDATARALLERPPHY